ncbi:hypothetical protein [Inquilinus sp.]|jgi:hypothetical protein|uniref:hypothetical protein n=1 Tax=Inquilinus sp. TaxID=1932117 RepID=UPI0037843B64
MRITAAMMAGREPPPEDYTREEVERAMVQVDGVEVPAEVLAYADDTLGEAGRYVVDEHGRPTAEVEILRGPVMIGLRSKSRIKAQRGNG